MAICAPCANLQTRLCRRIDVQISAFVLFCFLYESVETFPGQPSNLMFWVTLKAFNPGVANKTSGLMFKGVQTWKPLGTTSQLPAHCKQCSLRYSHKSKMTLGLIPSRYATQCCSLISSVVKQMLPTRQTQICARISTIS